LNTDFKKVILSSIKENESHKEKIINSVDKLKSKIPLNLELFENLSEGEITYLDQILFRFTKMQDSIGGRLLPSLYNFLENNNARIPFLDILHFMEKQSIIPSTESWIFFRNLRNNLSHEYPESIDKTIENLNLFFSKLPDFFDFFESIKKECTERKLL